MNLYEISVVDGKGITHKSKVYEINVDAAFKEAFIQGRICGAEKLDDCTVRQIQTNAGVSKDTEREYLGRIKNILDALGQRIAELEAELQKARQMEGQARKEAAEFKIALEDTKKKILPADITAELTAILKKQADEAAKEALYYADRMAVEVENSVPVGATNSAKCYIEHRKAQSNVQRLLDALEKAEGKNDDD